MRVNVKTGGAPVRFLDWGYDISDDARYVVFEALDPTVVPNDTNGGVDTFLHDRMTCTTTLVSRTPAGVPGSGGGTHTFEVRISGDGLYIIFESDHTNLVPNDNAGKRDVFLYNRQTQTVERLSKGMAGAEANGHSYVSEISADGRFVLFVSDASNLVPNDTNAKSDLFLLDRQTNAIERVSINSSNEQGNDDSSYGGISNDGRYVAFISKASNFTSIDTTLHQKAFLRDRQTGTTTLVSMNTNGDPSNGDTPVVFLSGDGRYAGMITDATNLAIGDTNGQFDSYLRDRVTSETTWVTPQNTAFAYAWAISADGRYVATETPTSVSSNDTNDLMDVFVYDRQTGVSTLQSRTPLGQAANGNSIYPNLTPDGKFILFESYASDLTADPVDSNLDLFLARVTLPKGNLNGQTTLQGRPTAPNPAWVASVRVVIVPEGSTTPISDTIVNTDQSGAFTLENLPFGKYTLWVKGSNTLAISQNITLATATLNVNVGTLRAGDANNDNRVNLVDFSILASSFGTQLGDANYDARADFNGDNRVTLPDFSLLSLNFSTTGDPLPS